MKSVRMSSVFAVLALGLAGCLPEERIVWAPDGSAALVLSADKLFSSDPAGKLTFVAQDISDANWMSDSKRLVVVRKVTLGSWKDAAAVLPDARQAQIAALSDKVRQELLAFEGDLKQYKPDIPAEHLGDLALILLHLRDHAGQDLPKKLGAEWPEIKEAKADLYHLAICDAAPSAPMGKTLVMSLACSWPQAAPNGRAICWWGYPIDRAMAENALVVTPVDGGDSRLVAERTSAWSAWSPDGRHLAYTAAGLPKGRDGEGDALRLGTVSRSTIFDDGQAMPPVGQPFPREDLAGVLFHEEAKVAYLPDGRILFSSLAMSLPSTREDMPQVASLFMLTPDQPTVVRALSQQTQAQLTDPLRHFSVSRDGKRVAVYGRTGRVSVVWLATGNVQTLVESQGKDTLMKAMPAWRSDTELTLIAPAGSKLASAGADEVVMVTLTDGGVGHASCLSKDWPEDVRRGLLAQPVATTATAAATQPAP